ncbi:polyprenyl synthetase family protein [Kocuria coralli]|uniref:Polyprenyl synthetase family protein n=1 Tax=Kocuria coralli TaxID=1461025 RepID=A0A5J5L1T2_9MICC|nr:polyprenyl synthetase family protein [Kocuria coralli]
MDSVTTAASPTTATTDTSTSYPANSGGHPARGGRPPDAPLIPGYAADADRALDGFLRDAQKRAITLSPRFAHLWEEIARLTAGGKRLRPALVQMTARAYSGQRGADDDDRASPAFPPSPWQAVGAVGAAFELLHTALIIHDDVIDRDDVRRHEPTLHAAAQSEALGAGSPPERAEHHGRSVAIIAGDLALAGAHRLVATAGLPADVLDPVLALLDEAVFASAAGELLDIENALGVDVPPVGSVLSATQLKTSVYSFEAPLKAGAILMGAPSDQVRQLGAIGRGLGLAFQLADDLLGVFGSGESTGKSTDGDLREGKHTLLIAEAVRSGAGPELLDLLRGGDPSPEQLQRARKLLECSGARAAVEALARESADQAVAVARAADLPGELVAELESTAKTAVERIR